MHQYSSHRSVDCRGPRAKVNSAAVSVYGGREVASRRASIRFRGTKTNEPEADCGKGMCISAAARDDSSLSDNELKGIDDCASAGWPPSLVRDATFQFFIEPPRPAACPPTPYFNRPEKPPALARSPRPHKYPLGRVYVTARGARDTWPSLRAARVDPRAICCFYDLEDRAYNNSVARATSGTLFLSLARSLPRSPAGPISSKSAGSPRVRAGDTSPIRACLLLILVLDGERSSIPFATLALLFSLRSSRLVSVFSRSRTEIRAAMKAAAVAAGGGRGVVSREYIRVVAAKISFRFPSCSATYCDPCLHAGVLD